MVSCARCSAPARSPAVAIGRARARARSFRAASRRRARFPPIRSSRCRAAVGLGVPRRRGAEPPTRSCSMSRWSWCTGRSSCSLPRPATSCRRGIRSTRQLHDRHDRPVATRGRSPTGVWEAFQALSRLGTAAAAQAVASAPFNDVCSHRRRAAGRQRVAERCGRAPGGHVAHVEGVGRGRRTISYADLGVEQLGAVYEHLLDFVVSTQDPLGARIIATGHRKATGSFYTPRALTESWCVAVWPPWFRDERRRDPGAAGRGSGDGERGVPGVRMPLPGAGLRAGTIEEGTVAAGDLTSRIGPASAGRWRSDACSASTSIRWPAARPALHVAATLAADKPLTFLDHRLRVGHSSIGASLMDVVSRPFPGRARRPRDLPLFPADEFATSMESVIGVRRQIAEGPDDSLEQVRGKERTLAALESENGPLGRWREAADLWCAAWLDEEVGRDRRTFAALLDHVLQRDSAFVAPYPRAPPHARQGCVARRAGVQLGDGVPRGVLRRRRGREDSSGFDVVLGNPPWDVLHETEGRDPGGA